MIYGIPYQAWEIGALIAAVNSGLMYLWFSWELSIERFRGGVLEALARQKGFTYTFGSSSAWKEPFTRLPMFWGGRLLCRIPFWAAGVLDGADCRIFECSQFTLAAYESSNADYTVAAFRVPGESHPRFSRDIEGRDYGVAPGDWHIEGDGEWTLVYRYGDFMLGSNHAVGDVASFGSFLNDAATVRRSYAASRAAR